jgi:hypothetical protein
MNIKGVITTTALLFYSFIVFGITVEWGYPTNGATPFNLVFVIGGTTNLSQPQPDWPVIAEVPFTNTVPIVSNQYQFQVIIPGTNVFQGIRAMSWIDMQEVDTNLDAPSESP